MCSNPSKEFNLVITENCRHLNKLLINFTLDSIFCLTVTLLEQIFQCLPMTLTISVKLYKMFVFS